MSEGDTPTIDESTSAVLGAPDCDEVEAALHVGWEITVALSSVPSVVVDRRLRAMQAIVGHTAGLDAVLVTNLDNVRALSGFTGSAGRLLVTAQSSHLITDARYEERAAEELAAARCDAKIVVRRSISAQNEWLAEFLRSEPIAALGLEASSISWADQQTLAALVDGLAVVGVHHMVERLRRTKSTGEIARTARASAIADAALASVLPLLNEAPTERGFQRALDQAMLSLGADAVSFETIIASGPNASRPHHEPGTRVIVEGDEVICDFGALIDGYHSDVTRTVYVGEPSKAQQRHFNVVRNAHDAGAAAIAPGITCVDLDRAAREVCEAAGWGEQFVHGLGHGTGLVIHELPWLGPTSRNAIADGDFVTIEPGVYLPGVGGVRIEDLYVVTAKGPIAFTRAPVDLVV